LGSGTLSEFYGYRVAISDHHEPRGIGTALHLNPHLYGKDGSYEVSGAGVTYLIAKEMDARNVDLSALAIVGAVGDLQDSDLCELRGMNREILNDGKKAGVLDCQVDLHWFGRETRPVYKLLEYASDPLIPGLTGNEENCLVFLNEHRIPLMNEGVWRRWIDLSHEEKKVIISSLVRLMLSRGFGHKKAVRIVGEVYTLRQEKEGTPVHDAKEFATLLNSTARYGYYDVGLQVCLGDRGEPYKQALSLLLNHRSNLAHGIDVLLAKGVIERDYLQYINAGNDIKDTIVGTVANMILNSGSVRRDLPLIAFANAGNNQVKVSARADRDLIERGLNLALVMSDAAAFFGGKGGGHNIAAGATIPQGAEAEFLERAEAILKNQLADNRKF
jgi:RecJ-like exonuclease